MDGKNKLGQEVASKTNGMQKLVLCRPNILVSTKQRCTSDGGNR